MRHGKLRNTWLRSCLAGAGSATVILLMFAAGCGHPERIQTEDPAEIEKQRQEHLEMTRRELEET